MTDLLFVAVMVAFFLIAMAFVRACDRIAGPDVAGQPVEDPEPAPGATTERRAA